MDIPEFDNVRQQTSAVPGTGLVQPRPTTAPGFEEGCLDSEHGRARSMVISLKRIADALSK